jgi:hypothetical protein
LGGGDKSWYSLLSPEKWRQQNAGKFNRENRSQPHNFLNIFRPIYNGYGRLITLHSKFHLLYVLYQQKIFFSFGGAILIPGFF